MPTDLAVGEAVNSSRRTFPEVQARHDRRACLSPNRDPSLLPASMTHPRLTRALASRNYRLFFGGQSVSLVGTWITRIATSWLVYRLTGSELLLGVVGFCGQIPTLILAPFAGVLVDRWDRHRILVVTQVLSLLQSAALAVLDARGHHHGDATHRAAGRAGDHQRLRHAGAAGVRRRDGRGPRRSAERHRAQLVDGQRAAGSSVRRSAASSSPPSARAGASRSTPSRTSP